MDSIQIYFRLRKSAKLFSKIPLRINLLLKLNINRADLSSGIFLNVDTNNRSDFKISQTSLSMNEQKNWKQQKILKTIYNG